MANKPRLRDVAEHAGVAVSTASMALSNHPDISPETRERVLKSSRSLSYPSRRGRRSRGTVDGQLRLNMALFGADPREPAYASLMMGLVAEAGRLNTRLEIFGIADGTSDEEIVQQLLARAEDADVTLICGPCSPEVLKRVIERRVRLLLVGPLWDTGKSQSLRELPRIGFDDVAIGQYATEVLIRRGHRSIAFVCSKLIPGMTHDQQWRGYQLALLREGITSDPDLLATADAPDVSQTAAVDKFMSMDVPPTAYVIANAVDASALRTAFAEANERLRPENVIILDSAELGSQFGMQRYHAVRGRTSALIKQVFARARDLANGVDLSGVHIMVQFDLIEL